MRVEGQRWNLCFSKVSCLTFSSDGISCLTDTPETEQNVPVVFASPMPSSGQTGPRLIALRATVF